MTTTPTIWKSSFTVNAGSTAGSQTVPQSIGLASGNILVIWEDDSDNNGPSPFIDVVGRVFDPEDKPVAAPFQVNSAIVASDETGPKIAALPDGGYVVAYGGYLEAIGGFIEVQRFDSNGNSVFSNSILGNGLTKWEITADNIGNYTVVFEVLSGPGDTDVRAIAYDHATNARGTERHNTAPNSGDYDLLRAVASFANGHMVTLTQEPDVDIVGDEVNTVQITVSDPLTGNVIRHVLIEGEATVFISEQVTAIPEDVAVLTGGQFVMVYTATIGYGSGSEEHLYLRIGAGEAGAISDRIEIAPGSNRAHVVGLRDGDFFVAWTSNGVLQGERFHADGASVGGVAQFASGVSGFAESRLSLTADGRILIPYVAAGEIAEVILDPRDTTIHGTAGGEILTTQVGNTSIFGEGGDDTLLGQGGADTLDGGPGTDMLSGGPGNDTYILADTHRPDPLLPQFAYDTVVEAADEGTDRVQVQRVGSKQSYTLGPNVENGIVAGIDVFTLSGNELDNRLTGNAASNTLSGRAGDDILDGGAGVDTGSFSQYRSVYDVRAYVQGGQLKTDVIHSGSDGADVLTGIELLAFTDGTFHNDGANLNHISNALGNRFDDVLFQSASTGQVLVAGMWGGAFNGWNVGTGTLGSAPKAIAAGDVNPAHIGGAEVFVQDTSNGAILYYSLDTGSVTSGTVSTNLTADWKLRGVGDINGNGGVDVVVQQASTGTAYYADMTGGAFQGWYTVNTYLTSDWVAVGAADVNRDGSADVVVQQQSTGTIYYANMVNGSFNGWGVVNAYLTGDWKVRAVGDVNGDGYADVVVQQASTGTAYYANMAGGTFSGWGVVAQNTGPAWVAQGLADVDNDGYRDVLMQNAADGTTYYAHMGASGFTNWGVVATNISADWHVV